MDRQTRPQVQAAKHVADFVLDTDGQDYLLIVFYSGHGYASGKEGLLLFGRLRKDNNARDICIDWTDVETILGKAGADVLVILDCCEAGILQCAHPSTHGLKRKFQYIAACKAGQRTRSSGDDSFSRAIIEAFQSLAEKPGFTTSDLVRKLTAYKYFPREDQQALVFDGRFGQVGEDIWITPLTDKAFSAVLRENKRQHEDGLPTADFLDLRFRFAKRATDLDVEATADALKMLIGSREDLRFHKISFLGPKSRFRADMPHWRGMVDVRSAAPEEHLRPSLQAGPERVQNAGLLGHIGQVVSLFLDGCGAVPAWHDTSFVVVA